MSTARDYLAAVQQRADRVAELRDRDVREGIRAAYEVASATDVPRLGAALTAVLDLHERGEVYPPAGYDGTVPTDDDRIEDACQHCEVEWPCPTVAAITDHLTTKENDYDPA